MAAKQGQQDFLKSAAALARNIRTGSLATVENGQPHAALVTFSYLPDGAPLFLFSSLAMHTRQLGVNPACALLMVGTTAGENPQTTPRLLFSGRAAVTDDPAAPACFLHDHPYAALYAGFTDFSYWRMEVAAVHYVGGFAAAAQLDPSGLRQEFLRAAATL